MWGTKASHYSSYYQTVAYHSPDNKKDLIPWHSMSLSSLRYTVSILSHIVPHKYISLYTGRFIPNESFRKLKRNKMFHILSVNFFFELFDATSKKSTGHRTVWIVKVFLHEFIHLKKYLIDKISNLSEIRRRDISLNLKVMREWLIFVINRGLI